MTVVKWVGREDFGIKIWTTKGEAVDAGAIKPKRVKFRFQSGWVDIFDGLLLKDGRRMPVYRCWLVGFGCCIGPRDRMAVTYPKDLFEAWMASFDAEILEGLKR
jgi:hypothetical protein